MNLFLYISFPNFSLHVESSSNCMHHFSRSMKQSISVCIYPLVCIYPFLYLHAYVSKSAHLCLFIRQSLHQFTSLKSIDIWRRRGSWQKKPTAPKPRVRLSREKERVRLYRLAFAGTHTQHSLTTCAPPLGVVFVPARGTHQGALSTGCTRAAAQGGG
jgi:hypothetical protein